jgi:hypothetical protein
MRTVPSLPVRCLLEVQLHKLEEKEYGFRYAMCFGLGGEELMGIPGDFLHFFMA